MLTIEFDFRLHLDSSHREGTQYFEFSPGKYEGKHWQPDACFLHEYTFSLFEKVFAQHLSRYDHYSCIEVSRDEWQPILRDLEGLRAKLIEPTAGAAALPVRWSPAIEASFNEDRQGNQRKLADLLRAFSDWVKESLKDHEYVSVLGL